MKKRGRYLAFLLGFQGLFAVAAIPPKVVKTADLPRLAVEILSLPEKNRYSVAAAKAEELYPHLIEVSKSEKQSMPLRWKALTLAAHLKKEKAISELEQALKAPEWFMRNAGLIALQSIDPSKARSHAKNLLKDKALVVRSAAVEVIGNPLDAETRDLFWEELGANYNFRQKRSLWVRRQIFEKLAVQPRKKEIHLFAKALKDQDLQMHSTAVDALERLTQMKLGQGKEVFSIKRQLWIKWVQAHSDEVLN